MKRCGFIGVGDQGGPMAQRMIESGLPVTIYARRAEVRAHFLQQGATAVVDSVAALAEQVDYVGICVVDDAAVDDVCRQLLPAMRPGGYVVIHSTVSPTLCARLAADAEARGLQLLDAPVSGGGQSAAAGTLSVMVGGSAEAYAAIRPVLDTFARRIFHLGPVGSGQKAKLVNNSLLTANIAVAYHALQAARELGIDRQTLVELIRCSSGHSQGFDVSARMQTPDGFAHGGALLAKDVGLLGDALGDSPAYPPIRDAAWSFLSQISVLQQGER